MLPTTEPNRLATLRDQAQNVDALQRKRSELRENTTQIENRLRALGMYVDQIAAESQRLSGFGLTAILYSLMGKKTDRLAALSAEWTTVNAQLAESQETLAGLQQEVETIERQLAQVGTVRDEIRQLMALKQTELEAAGGDAADRLKSISGEMALIQVGRDAIKKAIEAGDEAIRDLLDEMEVTTTFGRSKIGQGSKLISAVMKAGQRDTRNECASRTRASIGRFQRQIEKAIAAMGSRTDAGLIDAGVTLKRLTSEFSGCWLSRDAAGDQSAASAIEHLRNAGMQLEHAKTQLDARAAELDKERSESILREG